jgi:WD40 repeat protein
LDGKLVLVDFGAAKYATGTALGKTGTTIGSAGYAAPEQTFGQAVFASDIYSLGVTCIHLLTNIEPFELYNAMESAFVWRHHLGNNPVSDQLGSVLDKMTQSVVKQRYKSAEGVMRSLGLKVGTQTSKNKPHPQINRQVIQSPTPSVGRQSGTPAPVPTPPSSAKTTPPPLVQTVSPRITSANVRLITTLSGHSSWVNSVTFSPDGQLLASGSGNSTIKLWDMETMKELRILKGHSADIRSVAFSPDGQILASGSDDNTIKLWDVHNWKELRTLEEHSKAVNSVAFSPDGRILASGSDDKTINCGMFNLSYGMFLVDRKIAPLKIQILLSPSLLVQMDTLLPVTLGETSSCGMCVAARRSHSSGGVWAGLSPLLLVQMDRSLPVVVLTKLLSCGMFTLEGNFVPSLGIHKQFIPLRLALMDRPLPVAV